MLNTDFQFTVVVPAAGVGKRMAADRPKQYLKIGDQTVLEHTLHKLISHPNIQHIVVALHPHDPYFDALSCSQMPWLTRVNGGKERADSVLAGLQHLTNAQLNWILVHDAARPCVSHADITKLLSLTQQGDAGGVLACPVRDTMKRALQKQPYVVAKTIERNGLWHALTPQCFPYQQLKMALANGLDSQETITDEASAMEIAGYPVHLVESSDKNIKITRPDDLALAAFYLSQGSQKCE
jgi:2-C-methyl-D-erythritol 4-phosphate cytidylyltransferase